MFKQLWNDDCGVVTIEYLVLGTFLALALIVGVATLAASINAELSELSSAILNFNQTYFVSGQSSCNAGVGGSGTLDTPGAAQIVKTAAPATGINDANCL